MDQGFCPVGFDLPVLSSHGLRPTWGSRAAVVGGENQPGGAAVAGLFRPARRGLREGEAPPGAGPSRRNRTRPHCFEALYRSDRTRLEEGGCQPAPAETERIGRVDPARLEKCPAPYV